MNMNQSERRQYLIKYLLNEEGDNEDVLIPEEVFEQKAYLRGLMNIRPPKEIDQEFLDVQDAYLKETIQENGIFDYKTLKPLQKNIYLWRGDITTLACDGIVNAANDAMEGCYIPNHTCIDNCIHTFAGVQLRLDCAKRMRTLSEEKGGRYSQPTGVPMLTPGYNLPAKYVIHVVGPIVHNGLTQKDEDELKDCYWNTLELCKENGLTSVGFCCISTGVFHFPKDRAAEIAVATAKEFLEKNDYCLDVIFNVFGSDDYDIYNQLLNQ